MTKYFYDKKETNRIDWFEKLKKSKESSLYSLKRILKIIKAQGYYRTWSVKQIETPLAGGVLRLLRS